MFCYVPATSASFSKCIFMAATNSTSQTNKAVVPLISVSFLDVYEARKSADVCTKPYTWNIGSMINPTIQHLK